MKRKKEKKGERERKRKRNINHLFSLFMHSLIASNMCPYQGFNTTLAYRDDIPTNWAARPGQDEVSFIHILCFANYQFKQLIDWNNYCPDSYKKQLVR